MYTLHFNIFFKKTLCLIYVINCGKALSQSVKMVHKKEASYIYTLYVISIKIEGWIEKWK